MVENTTRPAGERPPAKVDDLTAHDYQEAGSGADEGGQDQHEGAVVTTCRVPGCGQKVRETSQRPIRVCPNHQRAAVLHMEDGQSRFCQQCRRIHPLDRFEGNRKGCRQRLAHRVERRHQKLSGSKHAADRRDGGEEGANKRANMEAVKDLNQASGGDGSDKMTNFIASEQLSKERKSGSGTGSQNNVAGPHSTDSGGKTETPQERRFTPSDEGNQEQLRARSNDGRPPPAAGMPSWLHSDWTAGRQEASELTEFQELQSQVQWQWHSSYQMGMQLRAQQKMQQGMARQLEWQSQLLCHLNQTLGSESAIPAPPPMPNMSSASARPSRSEPSSWGAGYLPSFGTHDASAHSYPTDGSNAEFYGKYPPPQLRRAGERK